MSDKICVVGNYIEIPEKDFNLEEKENNSIIFVGKMSYEPNILAVSYFVKSIFLKLRNRYPDLKFTIVGANPDERVKKLCCYDGVEVTGYVESIEPYFQKATIVVAPMLTGAGVQNKIIQAMSYGCCIATTPIGEEGLCIKKNEIAIFSTTQDWIDGLSCLLENKKERIEMGKRARNNVEKFLSKDAIRLQFIEFIKDVVRD